MASVVTGESKPHYKSRFPASFLSLPSGEDPANFLTKRGGQAMKKEISDAMASSGIKVPKQWLNQNQ